MSWILEDPLYVVVLGIISAVILGFGWIQTHFRLLGYATGGTVLLTIALVLLEHFVVTDNEQLEAALHQMARDVEQNQLDLVLRHIHPRARNTIARAEAEFPRYKFTRVDIKRNLKIEFEPSDRTRATATFNVVVVGQEMNYATQFHVPLYVELQLQKTGDRWQVTNYRYEQLRRRLLRGPQ